MENAAACFDKQGNLIELRRCDAPLLSQLLEMYARFRPKPASQGLPPANPEVCRSWVANVLENGMNVLACRNGLPVGHAAILADHAKGDGEFLIFVHQDYRNLGIGTALTMAALDLARDEGLKVVWLTVETVNFHAVRLYLKVGFQYCDTFDCERMMRIEL